MKETKKDPSPKTDKKPAPPANKPIDKKAGPGRPAAPPPKGTPKPRA